MSGRTPAFQFSEQQCSLSKFFESLSYKDVPRRECPVFLKAYNEHVIVKVYFTVLSLQAVEGKLRDDGSPLEWKGRGEIRKPDSSKQGYKRVSQLSFLLVTSYEGDFSLITGGRLQFHDLNWL